MPVSLRKRLTCHYCGRRLNTARKEGNRIHCDSCSADNYLDAKNNIVDVPATVAAGLQNGPHVEVESESDVFCKTCLTNQAFYIRALSDYLPDEDDPRYEELVRLQPQFEQDLALRYPQCCAQCEPRVEARIKQANYAAKSDHLRRLMHRKHGRRKSPELQLRSLFISVAGLGQFTSLLVQQLWHLSASQQNEKGLAISSRLSCLKEWPPNPLCSAYAATLVPYSLVTALLCIWWNPKWQHRLFGKEGRLTGLRNFYLTQCFLLALRFAAWTALTELSSLQPYAPILHTICLGAFLMLAIYSWTGIIHVDHIPLVDWHKVQPPLTNVNQFRLPDPPPNPHLGASFSIQDLAAPPSTAYEPWRPPTPPLAEDDSMDWAPSTRSFEPRPRVPPPRFDQPSPFHGTLPAAPARGSLNPQRPTQETPKKALGLPPGFFGLSKTNRTTNERADMDSNEPIFASAKFFAHEREADTGLESIFDKMFSVRDPLDTQSPDRNSRSQSSRSHAFQQAQSSPGRVSSINDGPNRQPNTRLVVCCGFIISLAVVASSLCSLEMAYGSTTVAPSSVLPYTALNPFAHFVEEYVSEPDVSGSTLLLLSMEALGLLCAHVAIPQTGSDYVPIWNKLVVGIVCFLLLQEIYRFCQLQTTPMSNEAMAHMADSVRKAEQEDSNPRNMFETPSVPSAAQPLHALPSQAQWQSPAQSSSFAGFGGSVRKRDSDESISSVSSIQTTSTAPGWKTPKQESRSYDWQEDTGTSRHGKRQSSGTIARGLDSLSLGNQFSGAGVAGPRNATPRRAYR